jgi:hypothetical protein
MSCGNGSGGGGSEDQSSLPEDGSGPPPKEELPLVIEMERYGEADFLSKVEADPELQKLWNVLQGLGFTGFPAAGISRQDNGAEVLWGEASGMPGTFGLVRRCKEAGKDCTHAIFSLSGGKTTFLDADDKPVDMTGLGLPILLKQLEGHTFDKPTHVVELPLEPPAELPTVDVTKRRFLAVSAFGPLWADGALSLAGIESAANDSAAFDAVLVTEYVRSQDVDDALLHYHPFDAFVWLGQTIREEAKTNEIYKPVGMTVNAGLFGDALYDRGRIEELVLQSPLHGPGLVVLAGCETMGDGAGGETKDKSIPVTLDNKVRLYVGFERCGDARDLLAATEAFLRAFLVDGLPLGASLDVANELLAQVPSQLVMKTLADANLEYRFLRDVSKYWEQYAEEGTPADTLMSTNINIVNMCVDKDGKSYQENEFFATAWSKEVSWQGPFFAGSRKNPDNQVDFTVDGALGEIAPGAHFFFVVKGDLSPRVQGLTLYGDGEIEEIVLDKEKPDEFVIKYKGVGVASEYVNEFGDKCQMQSPLLKSSTGESSTFKVPVTWKNKPQEE